MLQHLTGNLVVNLALGDQGLKLHHGYRFNTQRGQLNLGLLGLAGNLTHPPLAGSGCTRPGGNSLLNNVKSASVDHVTELFIRVPPLVLQAAAALRRRLGQACA